MDVPASGVSYVGCLAVPEPPERPLCAGSARLHHDKLDLWLLPAGCLWAEAGGVTASGAAINWRR